ncbi:MAG: response regulator transcription factor [Dehalococcoidia bacterium]|nr:response regulator transcription factor [Dehalococcoidia bacterium]
MDKVKVQRPRILIVDDDTAITKFIRANLESEGWQTIRAADGAEALKAVEKELPVLVILDVMMPNVDGFDVLHRLRQWSQIPVIMLSVRDEMAYKVKCLNLGADDYITKPFGADELVARVRAVLRRNEQASLLPRQPYFTSGDIEMNLITTQVTVSGNQIKLTPIEYNLLQELVLNAGKVLPHSHLLHKIWGVEYGCQREYLHVFIARLRAKLEPDPTKPRYIITVPGIGYRFQATT